jgi:hypothetical protein
MRQYILPSMTGNDVLSTYLFRMVLERISEASVCG